MKNCLKTLIIMSLIIFMALCMVPVSAAGNAQYMVIYTDDNILGRITSITPDPDAGALSVTITNPLRGINVPQPAKVGDTLLQNDMIMLVPGVSANVKFADRPVSTLRGGTEGTVFVIQRGAVAAVTTMPEVTGVVVTGTVPDERSFTIPRDSTGELKVVTITSTGGSKDYILRGGTKITVKNGMEIKRGDKIFIVGKYSIGLSEDKYLPPGTIWTINEQAKTPGMTTERVSSGGFAEKIAEWLQPFYGFVNDIEKGFSTFFTSPGSSED